MFNFFNKNKDHFSQSGQDQFAYNISGDNGIYLEIGAHHPIVNSNTYNLEVECGWKGLSVEFDKSFKKYWDNSEKRNNPIIWEDAFKIDYLTSFNEYAFPKRINYLSCDIEPPKNTLWRPRAAKTFPKWRPTWLSINQFVKPKLPSILKGSWRSMPGPRSTF